MFELYPFQTAGRDFLVSRGRACLFDEMGLGKTPQALCAAKELDAATILIVCPTFAISTWQAEIEKWFPSLQTSIISGTQREREAGWLAWGELRASHQTPRALITTYRHLEEVSQAVKEWDLAIYDEAHLISNRKTIAFKAAKKLKSRWLAILTGTPTRKSPEELWCYLHLIDRKRFGSYWRFVGDNFLVNDGRYGKEILGLSHPAAFRELLVPYCLRRLKAAVLTELPPLQRQNILVDLAPEIRAAYDQLAEEMLLEMGEELITAANPLALLTRLRQLTICPAVLGLEGDSALMIAARDIANTAMKGGGKAVVFCPYREPLHYLSRMLAPGLLWMMHGAQDRELNAAEIAAFQNFSGPGVLLATCGMGASWSANTASTCIFLGYSYSPIENLQCEGRLHRHGQANAVNAYYIGAKGTIDESIAAVIAGKVALAELALDPRRLVRPNL